MMPNYNNNNKAYPYNSYPTYYTRNYYNSQPFMHNQPYFSSTNNTYPINNTYNHLNRSTTIPLSNRANFFAPNTTGGILNGGKSMSGLLNGLRGFNWSSLFNGTQKTLSTINQIIPLYYRAAPVVKNARTLLSVARAVGKSDDNNQNTKNETHDFDEHYNNESEQKQNKPTFF